MTPLGRRLRPVLGAIALCTAAAPSAGAEPLVLVCYMQQSGWGLPSHFIRRVEIDFAANSVSVADDLGAGFRPLPYRGRLSSANASAISFDYESAGSSGRSTIDRKSGGYTFTDGRFVVTGACAVSGSGQRPF